MNLRWYINRAKYAKTLPAALESSDRIEEKKQRIIDERLAYNKEQNPQDWLKEVKSLGKHEELKSSNQLYAVYLDEQFTPWLDQLRSQGKIH